MANVVSFNVYQIDNNPVRQGDTLFTAVDFPAELIFAREANIVVSGVQMNAFIVFNSQQYYVAETVADIETAANAGSSSGPTIYTGDGSLTDPVRNFNLNGNTLNIIQGGNIAFQSAVDGGVTGTSVYGLDTSSGNTGGEIIAVGSPTEANVYVKALYQDGNNATITAYADADGTSLTYAADTHTFNGVINLPTQSAPASPNDGDIWREDNTDTGLKIRVNGVTKTIVLA